MEIDNFAKLAKMRRVIRRFKSDPVPEQQVKKILDIARWAPSGANGQPWEFVVVRDSKVIKKIFEAKILAQRETAALESNIVPEMRQPRYRGLPNIPPEAGFRDAPLLIVVCGDPRTAQASVLNQVTSRRWVVDENMANVTLMIQLAATAYGLGSQWVTVLNYYEELIRPILGVPPAIRIFNLVPIGYPAYTPKPTYRRDLEQIIHYEKYDMTKYRSAEDVREFIRNLRERSKVAYPLK